MGHIPEEIIQEIESRLDIVSLIGRYVSLKNRGGKYWGLSPFKVEKTPSFTVDPVKKLYYCFSTQQGGSAFTFIQSMENINFPAAVRVLAKETGVHIPEQEDRWKSEKRSNTYTHALEILSFMGEHFEKLLHSNVEARKVLEYLQKRKINKETMQTFHLGYVSGNAYWVYNMLSEKGYSAAELAYTGLFSKNSPSYCLFAHRLVFPIFRSTGNIVGFGGRLIEGDGPKYLNSPQNELFKKNQLLYGLYQAQNAKLRLDTIYVVEGYFDVLAMHQAGSTNTVAPLGTALTQEQVQYLRRFTSAVVLVFDSDAAGRQAAVRAARMCESVQFKSIRIVTLPQKDPADLMSEFGEEGLRDELSEEMDFFDYYIGTLYPYRKSTQREKEENLNELSSYLAAVPHGYRKEMYMAKIMEFYGVSRSTLQSMLINLKQQARRPIAGEEEASLSGGSSRNYVRKTGELLAIAALCYNLENVEVFRREITVSDFEDSNARAIYLKIEELYRKNILRLSVVLESLDAKIANTLMVLMQSKEVSNYANSLVWEFINKVKVLQYKKRNREIDRLLAIQEQGAGSRLQSKSLNDINKNTDITLLLEEKQQINNELRKLQGVKTNPKE